MNRNKKIVLIMHCILNGNSKVEGLANYEGSMKEIINLFIDAGVGIIQLPCPEMAMYGIKRWEHVKEQFDTLTYREKCRELIIHTVQQLVDYDKNGYSIVCLVGLDGSPSCGVNKTCSSKWGGSFQCFEKEQLLPRVDYINEAGIYVEEIEKVFKENNLDVPFISVDEMDFKSSIKNIETFIKENI